MKDAFDYLDHARVQNELWNKLESYGLHCGGLDMRTGLSAVCVSTPEEGGGAVLGWMDPATLRIEWSVPLEQVISATQKAGEEYYIDGEAYVVEGRYLCICHRWRDEASGRRGINFKGIERNLFCDPEKMGTFLPGIADKEMEISRWIGVAKRIKPIKMSLDEYLGQFGLDSPLCNYDLDKWRLPHGETARQKRARMKALATAQEEHATKRAEKIKEYQEKVERGEIIPKTAVERTLDRAQGHSDNESVQAARRILKKRGIDWRTGEPLNAEEEEAKREGDDAHSVPSETAGAEELSEDLEPEL